MNRLNEIEARANAATEGPWWADWRFTDWEVCCTVGDHGLPALIASDADGEDAEFIAHARTDVPDMAAALRAVLKLHKHHAGRGGEHCGRCFPDEWGWPCATVAAIHLHIGDDL